jgi:spermidine synthase
MPETRATAVEFDADVIDVARIYFGVPEECARLRLVVGEGAQYVAAVKDAIDVLLVDAYDGETLAASLGSDAFYQAARAALGPGGVFAMNLWFNDRAFERNLRRIDRAFGGAYLCLPAERPGNVIVFAFERTPAPAELRWTHLHEQAKSLERRFGLEFPAFVSALRRMNLHDETGLTLDKT